MIVTSGAAGGVAGRVRQMKNVFDPVGLVRQGVRFASAADFAREIAS